MKMGTFSDTRIDFRSKSFPRTVKSKYEVRRYIMQISTNAVDEVSTAKELLDLFNRIEEKADKIKGSFKFLTIKDVMDLTGYSEPTVQKLFRRKDFPAWEIGKNKIVFAPAFYEYAMKGVKD